MWMCMCARGRSVDAMCMRGKGSGCGYNFVWSGDVDVCAGGGERSTDVGEKCVVGGA